jgi:membrane protease YdiL (CAAX protease family)
MMRGAPARPLSTHSGWLYGYFCLYFLYLWLHPEGEALHWFSLVLVPGAALWIGVHRRGPRMAAVEAAKWIGFRWPRKGEGLRMALVLAALVQGIQLVNRQQAAELQRVLSSPEALWIVPAALGLIVATTAFTEEFFFRGLLQRSLTERTGSVFIGIAGATVAFSLYHVPYAYLLPSWPSAGNLVDALQLGFANGVLGGVILGLVFARSHGSLVPVVFLHAAVDWIPAIRALGEWAGLI